jgi:ribonucleoside-diphosphate reductase alpha chain
VNEIKASWEDAVKAPNGYRNAHVTVLAPTGTIGIQMDCDTTGIEPDFSLHKYKKLSGGGYIKMVNQAVPEALVNLKYTNIPHIMEEFEKSGKLIVNEEHKPVFACANEIHWKGHVLAMAAAQPFLSGAISKTINMHHDATVNDIKEALLLSHKHALKCNAIYRDGSKLSQPLNLKLDSSIAIELPKIKDELNELTTSGRGIRNKPPARRAGWTDEFTINGFKYYLRHNVDSNNKLCELWIDAPNESSSVRTALNTMCRFMSKALQYGMPIEEIVDTFTGIQQDPRGLVQHENIKVCKSIYDAVGRFIAYMYLGQKDMAEVQTNMLVEESTDVVSQKKTMKECPRCSSTNVSMPTSCKNKCLLCGFEFGGCGE